MCALCVFVLRAWVGVERMRANMRVLLDEGRGGDGVHVFDRGEVAVLMR